MIARVDPGIFAGIKNAARFNARYGLIHQDMVYPPERGPVPGPFRGAGEAMAGDLARAPGRGGFDERIAEPASQDAVRRRSGRGVEIPEQDSRDAIRLGSYPLQYQPGGHLTPLLLLVVEVRVVDRVGLAPGSRACC